MRNGFRPRRVQTAEGELEIEVRQVRQAAETFASKLFPRTPKLLRTEPLKRLRWWRSIADHELDSGSAGPQSASNPKGWKDALGDSASVRVEHVQ